MTLESGGEIREYRRLHWIQAMIGYTHNIHIITYQSRWSWRWRPLHGCHAGRERRRPSVWMPRVNTQATLCLGTPKPTKSGGEIGFSRVALWWPLKISPTSPVALFRIFSSHLSLSPPCAAALQTTRHHERLQNRNPDMARWGSNFLFP